MQFILTNSYQQYREYIAKHHVNPNHYAFLNSADQLAGIENPKVIYVGNWYDRTDAENIITAIEVRTRDNHETKKEV